MLGVVANMVSFCVLFEPPRISNSQTWKSSDISSYLSEFQVKSQVMKVGDSSRTQVNLFAFTIKTRTTTTQYFCFLCALVLKFLEG